MQLKRLIAIAVIALSICACKEDNATEEDYKKELAEIIEEEKIKIFFTALNKVEVEHIELIKNYL